jgi:CelD/BcsL family acetyltransferase involved in cellulose biosynthesis
MTCTSPSLVAETLEEGAFSAIATDWEGLLTRSADNRIFYTPTWHRIWWEHFGTGDAYFITVRDQDGILQGLLPLRFDAQDGRRVLTLTGDFNVMDYMDGLAEKERAPEIFRTLWQQAMDDLRPARVELRHVPSSSPLIQAVHEARGDAELVVTDDEVCPVAILCSSWDGYLQMLNKKQRHEIRRKLRRAQEGADWAWRTVTTEADLERDMPTFFRLHELSGREKARFMTSGMRDYFRAIARELLRQGMLRLSVLNRDGVDVAATLSFLYRERYLLYNSGFDPAYAAFSPGIASVAHTIESAIEEHAVAFDFLSGEEPYKYQFGATDTHTCRVTLTR